MVNTFDANELLDVYGNLLTDRQHEILSLYYEEDFSYAEIGEELNISRAAVMDSVHRALKLLEKYEACVGYIEKRRKLDDWIDRNKDIESIQEIQDLF